ncbi:MAG: corrinoid protein [Firmicutes bacterium]|nr:corrinoid protein [Bacillota bacterium]
MSDLYAQMKQSILDLDSDLAVELAEKALDAGMAPLEAIEKGFAPGMEEIGEMFDRLEIFLPEVILAADAMIAAVERLKQNIEHAEVGFQGRVVIGTIKGDVHDIGKNIIKTMLIATGFEVLDLGKDVSPNTYVERAVEADADIIAMSALCTSTMLHMPDVVRILNEEGLRSRFKVIAGGAPVLPDWAYSWGADGYGDSASEAVQLCKRLTR